MKAIILTLIVCTAFGAQLATERASMKLNFNKNEAKEFLIGFALAVRVGEFVPEGFGCVTVSQVVVERLHNAIAMMRKGGISNMIHGIQTIIASLEDGASTCGDAVVEVKDYIAEVKNIVRGANFVGDAKKALFANAEVVGRDFAEFFVARRNKDHMSAGIRIGDIARIILWGDANPM